MRSGSLGGKTLKLPNFFSLFKLFSYLLFGFEGQPSQLPEHPSQGDLGLRIRRTTHANATAKAIVPIMATAIFCHSKFILKQIYNVVCRKSAEPCHYGAVNGTCGGPPPAVL